ncbi:hypothetical protein ACMD2_03866 [Ananas comosus]|uniref:NET domain-containing protein n=1 Tax=Ananas comosus TaxID=4615 RepID=A0A199W5I8_ANACO|nr:hypothetical protein ACMD2_03866 [Ananas comosus]
MLYQLSLKMSTDSSKKQNEFGPDYFGYYKHLLLELFSSKEDLTFPVPGPDEPSDGFSEGVQGIHKQGVGGNDKSYCGLVSFFAEGIGGGLSDYKKERLKAILHETAVCLNHEADEMLSHIVAACQIESDRREKEQSSCYANATDDNLTGGTLCSKKRKASSSPNVNTSDGFADFTSSEIVRQVCRDIQAKQGNGEICEEAVKKDSSELLTKICKMEQDLDELLNEVVSQCRPMTNAEKQQLGRRIQKLPPKALDRVVEIYQIRNSSDNVTLWRLYYYVETALKANKL